MSSSHLVVTIFCLAMLGGCDRSPVAPVATRHMSPPFAISNSQEMNGFQSVTGHYEFVGVNTGNDFKYSLSAIRHTDLSVSGEVEERTTFNETGELVRTMHGTVTCFTIIGNMALIAGIVDKVESFAPGQENLIPGAGFRLVVVDNGNGDDPPDMGSNARFGLPATSEQFCAHGTPFNLEPVQHGNITVRP